jgi:cytochrome c oxidase accessory protein FixG
MFDRDTLIVSYDAARGDPRGARKKGSDHKARGLGDCVDCTLCVQVCPTGIDIRAGLQYECIACAACVDACDEVMDKVGYPRGLIRYDTQNGLAGLPRRILRPRTIVYGLLLVALTGGLFWSLATRTPLGVDVLRDRNALYRTLPDGRIENVYNVKILNKDTRPHEYRIEAAGLPGIEVDYAGRSVAVAASSVLSVPVRVRIPAGASSGSTDVQIAVQTLDDKGYRAESRARFLAPVQ